MTKVRCPGCGKKYALKGVPSGPAIKCPNCGGTILLPEGVSGGRTSLRAELSRLASEATTESRPQDAPKVRVVAAEEGEFLSRRARTAAIVVGALLFLLIFGGGGWWLYDRTKATITPRNPIGNGADSGGVEPDTETAPVPVPGNGEEASGDDLPEAVLAAHKTAKDSDKPCREREALANWTKLRTLLSRSLDIPAAKTMLAEAEDRIAELEETINRRTEQLDGIEKQLVDAQAMVDASRNDPAKTLLRAIKKQLGDLPCAGARGQNLLDGATALLARLDTTTVVANGNGDDKTKEPPPAVAQGDLIIDKPKGVQRWRAPNWAGNVDIKLKGDFEKNEQYLSLDMKRSAGNKWVVSVPYRGDLTNYDTLLVDIRTNQDVNVALGIWIGDLFETKPRRVRPTKNGLGWTTVSFNVKGNGYKCKANGWTYGARLPDPSGVDTISLFFYKAASEPVDICNVRLRGQE